MYFFSNTYNNVLDKELELANLSRKFSIKKHKNIFLQLWNYNSYFPIFFNTCKGFMICFKENV